ncbi:MAG: TetR family transcriptional regulator C-terminal domain-containing protein [Nocardioidaceae bacterium]|nr:TetR family transcriptional regulator C-terminal domain-containing protein [Nocardioidaceae bacterium]MDQ3166066.1 TetR family transcriptional regulator C-terminal domain-containing protein [Actinomycetota bacterium]
MAVNAAADSADQRREDMLLAAAQLITERGFSDTRIADVARRVGASPALVIYYFGTKDRLLTEALRFSEKSFYAAVDEMLEHTASARERLETLVRLTCVPQGDDQIPGAWGLWFELWATAFRVDEVGRDRIELDQRWREMIARIIEAGQAAGEIGQVDAEDFAVTFSALLDGLSIQVALRDPVVDPDRACAIAMRVAASELGADWRRRR